MARGGAAGARRFMQFGGDDAAKAAAFDALYKTGFKQTGVVLLVLGTLVALVVVIIYIMNKVKQTQLQRVALHSSLIQLDNGQQVPYRVDAGKMALVNTGHEFSYTFWIYLGAVYQTTASHKLILQRGLGATATSLDAVDGTTNPVVFMDKATNKMYIAMATNKVGTTTMSLDDVLHQDSNGKYDSGFLIATVDYLPLQRWVNVTLTVRDGSAYVFLDGDLYSAVSVSDVGGGVVSSQARPIIRGTSGDLTIGHRINNTGGYMAGSSYFNYALTQAEVEGVYKNGPYKKSYFSAIGLGNYGLRSPIYNLDGA